VVTFCSRPHVKDVPFDTARFVVGSTSGVKVNGQTLVMGDEIPKGVLSVIALRQIYDTPVRLIETVEYARTVPGLVKACEDRNTSLDIADYEQEQAETPTIQNRVTDNREMCDECGHLFEDLTKHSKRECKRFQKLDKQKGN
jgi:hypothetical protein